MSSSNGPYWYRVELLQGTEPYCYFGRCEDSESEVLKNVEAGAYLKLEDLVYFDEDHAPRSWTDWDANFLPRILIHPRYIISIMPMGGDPRLTSSNGKKILNLPGANPATS